MSVAAILVSTCHQTWCSARVARKGPAPNYPAPVQDPCSISPAIPHAPSPGLRSMWMMGSGALCRNTSDDATSHAMRTRSCTQQPTVRASASAAKRPARLHHTAVDQANASDPCRHTEAHCMVCIQLRWQQECCPPRCSPPACMTGDSLTCVQRHSAWL